MVKQEDADRLAEKPLTREEIYTGQILHVVKDTVALPNGRTATREMALHRGAVAVVALDDEGNVVLEKQYRYPMGAVLEEIPAGKLEAGEDDPLGAAKRELREETGLVAETWHSLGIYYPSPAILTEKIHLFLARGLRQGEDQPDEDELLVVYREKLSHAVERVLSGEIPDGKTQCALLKVWLLQQMNNKEENV